MIDEHSCEVLEFDKVRAILAGYAASDLGRDLSRQVVPLVDVARIEESLSMVSEMKGVFEADRRFPIDGIKDVRGSLRKAEIEGAYLEPQELLDLKEALRVARAIKGFFQDTDGGYPLLERLASRMVVIRDIEQYIEKAVDPSGKVCDGASVELARIRREYGRAKERLKDKLDAVLEGFSESGVVQEPIVTIRDNRYVIPIKEEHRGRVAGVVHDRSASGATVFIEPLATVELNNRLRELQIEERREIDRVLLTLTDLVKRRLEEVCLNVETLAEFDLVYAKARMAQDFDAAEPRLNRDNRTTIVEARHPLLELRKGVESEGVVPLDIELGTGFRTLVITGPNAGGKTVALKTVGLLTLMAQAGLAIPAAEGTEIAVYRQIFADIGDEQSIEQDLSTFSSHTHQTVKFLEKADRDTLVLLDELGAGTDPELGAALGMAILEELTRRGACTITTTHLGTLKVFAQNREGIENGSMEFDSRTLQPTYRFRLGIPGSSYAFQIATQLGMPSEIIDRSSSFVDKGERKLEELITDLNRNLSIYEKKREAVERKEVELDRLLATYQERIDRLEAGEKEVKRRAYEQAEAILAGANSLVERTVADVRRSGAVREMVKGAKRALMAEKVRIGQELEKCKVEPGTELEGVRPGERVFVSSLRSEGEVLSEPDSRGRVEVRVGDAKVEAAALDLTKVEGEGTAPKRKQYRPVNINKDVPREIDLRGLSSEEAIEVLDKYLDDAQLVGLDSVRIVHGKGTGSLRRKVGGFLENYPRVEGRRLGGWHEGGDGVTVVKLK